MRLRTINPTWCVGIFPAREWELGTAANLEGRCRKGCQVKSNLEQLKTYNCCNFSVHESVATGRKLYQNLMWQIWGTCCEGKLKKAGKSIVMLPAGECDHESCKLALKVRTIVSLNEALATKNVWGVFANDKTGMLSTLFCSWNNANTGINFCE